MPPFKDRLQHAWNAFVNNRDPTTTFQNIGTSYAYNPNRPRLSRGNERSIITSVYNRLAVDAADINIRHVRLDENDRFIEYINSSLNNCLSLEANIDQTGRALMQDIVMSMLDEGCVAIVPTDTSMNPRDTTSYDILTMRTGKITQWYPEHVEVELYNEKIGRKQRIKLPKKMVAIVENPFYAVMNEHNSTMKRLIRKLNMLDTIDEQCASGKLDLIIQLPYVVKSEGRRKQAEDRRKDIEEQLKGPYGIAYVDGTERITQLNRPVENNLMKQIEYLTTMLYSQLGLTQAIMEGTASEEEKLNYYKRTIAPILSAIVDEMQRKFLTKTARTQRQAIRFFMDPFKLVPVGQLVKVADVLTRNEIASSNEIRQILGWKPSTDPRADELRNSNMPQPAGDPYADPMMEPGEYGEPPNL